jgi:hypothetical protein
LTKPYFILKPYLYLGAEFLSLSSLFTAVVSANIFLIGFLISGVLVDYKESEKIPGDMAASIETRRVIGFWCIKFSHFF